MLSDDQPETIDKREAARLLGCSVRHLERLLVGGELEGMPNGPRGGLRPTRRGVEHRRAQTRAFADVELPAPIAERAPVEAHAPTIQPAPATVPAAPKRRSPSLARTGRKTSAALRVTASGCCQRARRNPLWTARVLVGTSLVVGLLLIGASRQDTPSAASTAQTLVVQHHDRQAIRIRCRIRPGHAVYVRIGAGRRVRCLTRRPRR